MGWIIEINFNIHTSLYLYFERDFWDAKNLAKQQESFFLTTMKQRNTRQQSIYKDVCSKMM